MHRLALASFAAIVLTGCRVGNGPAHYHELASARGPQVRVVLSDFAFFEGELIEIRGDSAVLVMTGQRLLFVSIRDVHRVSLRGRAIATSDGFEASIAERARAHARHPFGVDDVMLGRLLESLGQPRLLRVDRDGALTPL